MCHVLRLPPFMAASKRALDQMYDFRILNSEIIHLPSAGTKFQRFQSGFRSFILIFLAFLLYRFYFFLTKFISTSHFHHPDLFYHILCLI